MPITVNTNATAAAANTHLTKNSEALRKSPTRLSSGSRIVQPVDGAGGLAVSMKLESNHPIGWSSDQCSERNSFSRGSGWRA